MVHGDKPLVYLDNAATTQRPRAVIDAQVKYITSTHSNIHRSGHALATEATAAFEATRERVRAFINAASTDEIIFTKGTTESINLVASAWGERNLSDGGTVLVSEAEHHAVIVPLQASCVRLQALSLKPKALSLKLGVLGVSEDGAIDIAEVREKLTPDVKLLAITHVSNVLGTINNVAEICAIARERGIVTLIDGAQAVAHCPVDVQSIGCDFYAFSAHKLYGPTGVGVLYGRRELLDAMPPYQGGGSMISSVDFSGTTYNDIPYRFEAGTPNIEGVVGFGAALEWFTQLDAVAFHQHEQELLHAATDGLTSIDGLRIIGTAPDKVGIVTFVVDGIHANDVSMLCDEQGVALRSGHHCTMPLHKRFGLNASVRASFAAYTSLEDVDALVTAVQRSVKMLR